MVTDSPLLMLDVFPDSKGLKNCSASVRRKFTETPDSTARLKIINKQPVIFGFWNHCKFLSDTNQDDILSVW